MLYFLRILFASMSLYMIYVAVATSLESNLFEQWSYLAQIPWMTATLKDFYLNIAILYVWVWYKEPHPLPRILWLVFFVCLGAIATCFYVFLQLMKIKPGEPIERVLLRADPREAEVRSAA